MARKSVRYKKEGETAINSFTPEGHLILLSISTAYTLLRVSVSKTVEMANPYKVFSIIFIYFFFIRV
ncbi:hypothetical protein CK503_13920 [Aliifodinibius salipaludis]|uniref:Uncharacterized protein n=1 Tax=Fodinibius salipaludis TaxID=2032627 RepID=A0A2A2G5G8_9BACT|nr:hypothetical protein CK503_13920 [Aliifodinibius salipaludis]